MIMSNKFQFVKQINPSLCGSDKFKNDKKQVRYELLYKRNAKRRI